MLSSSISDPEREKFVKRQANRLKRFSLVDRVKLTNVSAADRRSEFGAGVERKFAEVADVEFG